MKSLENEQEPVEPVEEKKEGDSTISEGEDKKNLEETEPKPRKKVSFKPRKLKRPLVRIVKKNNYFIHNGINYIDYKDTKLLKLFTNKQGQIVSKIFSKLPSDIQRTVTKNIKRARQIKLMPYIVVDQGSFS